jgi:hypothetical protein
MDNTSASVERGGGGGGDTHTSVICRAEKRWVNHSRAERGVGGGEGEEGYAKFTGSPRYDTIPAAFTARNLARDAFPS